MVSPSFFTIRSTFSTKVGTEPTNPPEIPLTGCQFHEILTQNCGCRNFSIKALSLKILAMWRATLRPYVQGWGP